MHPMNCLCDNKSYSYERLESVAKISYGSGIAAPLANISSVICGQSNISPQRGRLSEMRVAVVVLCSLTTVVSQNTQLDKTLNKPMRRSIGKSNETHSQSISTTKYYDWKTRSSQTPWLLYYEHGEAQNTVPTRQFAHSAPVMRGRIRPPISLRTQLPHTPLHQPVTQLRNPIVFLPNISPTLYQDVNDLDLKRISSKNRYLQRQKTPAWILDKSGSVYKTFFPTTKYLLRKKMKDRSYKNRFLSPIREQPHDYRKQSSLFYTFGHHLGEIPRHNLLPLDEENIKIPKYINGLIKRNEIYGDRWKNTQVEMCFLFLIYTIQFVSVIVNHTVSLNVFPRINASFHLILVHIPCIRIHPLVELIDAFKFYCNKLRKTSSIIANNVWKQ
uniref:Uncharacterized protein n=1 Tax=Heterorhabditis bacteriophora TaxID=37862 RepID=A0A1I7XD69_HETBA